jgi:hypothetical protein
MFIGGILFYAAYCCKCNLKKNLGAFFGALRQKTGLSAAIPHKPLRGLLRDFRFNPLRAQGFPVVEQVLRRFSQTLRNDEFERGSTNSPDDFAKKTVYSGIKSVFVVYESAGIQRNLPA